MTAQQTPDSGTPFPAPAGEPQLPPPSLPAPVPARRRDGPWKGIAIGVVSLLVGVGIGAASTGPSSEELASAKAQLAAAKRTADGLRSDLNSSRSDNDALTGQVASEKQRADNAVAAAQAKVKAQFATRTAALDTRARTLNDRSAALDRRERKVSGLEHAWAANTIPGDGVFLVGSDVSPGIYKADASTGCYYARLSSPNDSDIIDNANNDGPAVLQVSPSDTAIETSGCADFHKVG